MALAALPDINALTSDIIKAAIEVHRTLGRGLFESVYGVCLVHELEKAGLTCQTQVPLRVVYKTISLDCGFRLDLIVQNDVVVEVKSIAQVAAVHRAQLKTYVVLAKCAAG